MAGDSTQTILNGEITQNLNTVLLYNCAAMCYQTQQFGRCLGYLTHILKHLEHFEAFLQIKALFLLL